MGCIVSIEKELKFRSLINHQKYRLIKDGEVKKTFLFEFLENDHKYVYDYKTKKRHRLTLIGTEEEYILLFASNVSYFLIDALRSQVITIPSSHDLYHVTSLFCCTPMLDYSAI